MTVRAADSPGALDCATITNLFDGMLPDEQNAGLALQTESVSVLASIACGIIDGALLARWVLANRGYSEDGEHVGFDAAALDSCNENTLAGQLLTHNAHALACQDTGWPPRRPASAQNARQRP